MRQSSISFLVILVAATMSKSAHSQSAGELDAWMLHAATVNLPTLNEAAGSHGALGLALGAGMSRYRVAQGSAISSSDFVEAGTRSTDMQRLWLVKGLPWPVDLIFTGGQGPDQRFTQATFAMQWNCFEGLALPSVALRTSAGGLFGSASTEASTLGLELATSFSPLPYVTAFAALGSFWQSVALHAREDNAAAYFLAAGGSSQEFERNWRSTSGSIGLKLLLYPPFVSTAAELLYLKGSIAGGSIKLSFGI